MAEWLKAAVLKTASPATRRGGGGSVVTEHKGTCVRRPAKRGEAERASTSYSFAMHHVGCMASLNLTVRL